MKPRSIFRLLSSLALIAICLITSFLGWIVLELPKQAEREFGNPSDRLSFLESTELSAKLLLQKDDLKIPSDIAGIPLQFTVERGESPYTVAKRLEEMGLISSAKALRDYLIYSGLDTTIQTGSFQLSPRQNALEIAWAMQDATPSEVVFRILPGWRLEEVAAALATSGLEFSANNFLTMAYQPPAGLPMVDQLPPGASLEGFLFPDRYRMPRKIDIDSFLDTILSNFEIKVSTEVQQGFEQQGLTLFEAVTLASIVQRESVLEEEMPLIASVFLNRLSIGMNLETDPTVQYALGYRLVEKTWWKNPLSLDDLKVDSRYNTYLNPALPPGPIANPGLIALQAVASPAQSSFYYFRSACDNSGRHNFAETFEQHQDNACPE